MGYNPNFSSIASSPSSQSLEINESNNSGGTISKLTPVRIDSSGNMATVDVSIEAQAESIAGLAENDITDNSAGSIVNSGRILNIPTAANFGDVLYVSSSGGTTHVKPAVGSNGFVEGDFVIRLGVVAKNQSNPSDKDLLVNISIVGQL